MGKFKTSVFVLSVRFNFHLLRILVRMIFKKFDIKNLFKANASTFETFVLC